MHIAEQIGGIVEVPPTYWVWNPKMVIFSHLTMWVTSWKGGKKKVKRPGAEIARVWEEIPCSTDNLQSFNTKQLFLNNSSKMLFAVNRFQAELHMKWELCVCFLKLLWFEWTRVLHLAHACLLIPYSLWVQDKKMVSASKFVIKQSLQWERSKW